MARHKVLGLLFVIEGPDGVGKTTLCDAIAQKLRNLGHNLLHLSFPGNQAGTVGELVYRLHHNEGPVHLSNISELAKQALHVAAHIDAIDREILPALAEGRTVLLDRYWWSAWVYGIVGGCDRQRLRALIEAERAAWGNVSPSMAILLRRPSPLNRDDPLAQWRRIAQEYSRLADRERRMHPVSVIDNTRQPEMAVGAALEQFASVVKSHKIRGDGLKYSKAKQSEPGLTVLSHIVPLKPSVVYDSYWRFASERQEVFYRRLKGSPAPWTTDPILAEYKFTNAYRASDRVSQYLIRNVIYRDDLPSIPEEVFFRVMLFKLFNKIETWEMLETAVGAITFEEYSFQRYDTVLTRAMARGAAIYSAAYIMPSGGRKLGYDRKHRNHLALVERMLADSVPRRLAECRKMQQAFELLKSYHTIGDFLAYQYVTDLNYSEIIDFNESEFVVPGPGALDGIQKCFVDRGGLNEPEIIKFMADTQDREFERLGLPFKSLWGRPLKLIDCQNLFCEVGKYARVRHPAVEGVSGRSRIKQRLDAKPALPRPWYPPKWGLNELIAKWQKNQPAPIFDTLYPQTKPE